MTIFFCFFSPATPKENCAGVYAIRRVISVRVCVCKGGVFPPTIKKTKYVPLDQQKERSI